MTSDTKWNEGIITRAVALQTLERKCLVLVDRCSWTGHECDVLAVTTDLRVIDVEVKISRSDFKADAKKNKWWHKLTYAEAATRGLSMWDHRGDPILHPPKVWKHYYAMPKAIWMDSLYEFMPSPMSGLLLLDDRGGRITVQCVRRATPNKTADRLTPAQAIDIARLANLRMWEAYNRLEKAQQTVEVPA